jgi:hypothetical protein
MRFIKLIVPVASIFSLECHKSNRSIIHRDHFASTWAFEVNLPNLVVTCRNATNSEKRLVLRYDEGGVSLCLKAENQKFSVYEVLVIMSRGSKMHVSSQK